MEYYDYVFILAKSYVVEWMPALCNSNSSSRSLEPGCSATTRGTSRPLYRLHLYHQRTLLPERRGLLLTHPIPLFLHELQVESEENLGENNAQFCVCQAGKTGKVSSRFLSFFAPLESKTKTNDEARKEQEDDGMERNGTKLCANLLLAQTIPRPKAKRIPRRPVVVFVPFITQPALRHKVLGILVVAL